jgi:hypothetical protein
VIRPAQALSDSLISGEAFVTAAVAVGHDPRPRPLPKCDAVAIDVDEGATFSTLVMSNATVLTW